MRRFITLDDNNAIINIRYGKNKTYHEIESETGDLGQIMQDDGTFIMPDPDPIEPTITMEDKINYIYYKQIGVI